MLTFAPTSLAISRRRPLSGYLLPGVFKRVFVAAFAMSSGLLSFRIGCAAQQQTRKVQHFGLRKYLFGWQPFVVSLKQRVDMDSQSLRPLHCSQRQSVMCDANINFSIVRLFFSSCPAAIFRTVRPVVVNTIQCIAGHPFAHISQKIIKIVPSLAQVNTALSIPIKSGIVWVIAPLFYGLPQNVNGSLRFAMTTFHAANVIQWSEKVK